MVLAALAVHARLATEQGRLAAQAQRVSSLSITSLKGRNMIYARVQDGIVVEVILPYVDPEGNQVKIAERFHSSLIDGTISWMVDITSISPQPEPGWSATEVGGTWQFSPPTTQ
jgi:hypothetical protein